MPKLTIDGIELEVPAGTTVLQAAESLGKEIPVFCYHPKLSVAGNCRMCLVEMEKSPKPIASCAMPVGEGMVIHTDSEKAKKARKGVLELLLLNHPLDCPICDQGGECDLQDISMSYGRDYGRAQDFSKRAVPDKNLGPLIETAMNRCIHCTRCVRFSSEIAGIPEMGATGRGEHTEIGTYVEKAITSELSGNMIDVCPVGALMSKPYSYRGRPWEVTHTQSIDVMDAVGSAIRIDSFGREVMRILPRVNEAVNEDWIADKARFSYDGLKYQRLDRPYIRDKKGRFVSATWDEAFQEIVDKLRGVKSTEIAALAGGQADVESMMALKDLLDAFGCVHFDVRQDLEHLDPSKRCSYLFNSTIQAIEDADFCLLVGANPRWEAPLVNARIRKNYLKTGLEVAAIGPEINLGYPVHNLSADVGVISEIASGKHEICKKLKAAKHPIMIVGSGILSREDGAAILDYLKTIAEQYGIIQEGKGHWNGFNILQTHASVVGGIELGFVPKKGMNTREIIENANKGKVRFLYLLGYDNPKIQRNDNTFIIYQGHHGDYGAQIADVVLPGSAYTEKSGTYLNMEGRVQRTQAAVAPPGDAREDWKIVRALSWHAGVKLPYDTLSEIRQRLVKVNPAFENYDSVIKAEWQEFGAPGSLSGDPIQYPIDNYYMTDPITRHSVTMANCTRDILQVSVVEKRTGTHD